jgi:hypothetical protein
MTKNYNYYFGGSLPVESPTYVKRQADDLLFQNLQSAKFSYVLNSRQMGKSSLMLRTKQRLENNGVGCVTIDLTDIGSQNINVTQWYRGLVEQTVDDLELEIDWEQWWDQNENKRISTVQMFGNFIRRVLLPEVANNDRKAVIFVDEVDSIINLDFGTDDFFAFIRACHNKRAEFPLYNCLTFCLLGVATPSDLIADKTRTPFNIGTAILIKCGWDGLLRDRFLHRDLRNRVFAKNPVSAVRERFSAEKAIASQEFDSTVGRRSPP